MNLPYLHSEPDIARHMTPTILALDLGATTGWALRHHDGRIASGSERFGPAHSAARFEGGGARFVRMRHWLTATARQAGEIGAVYFEAVHSHNGIDAAHAFGGYLATLTAWCELRRIPYMGVSPGTIKRHATGHGNADKQAVVMAMRRRGHHPETHDEADALALLHFAMAQEDA